jgi:aminoglycoside phosphotransferase (APT) family kinase protein
MSLDGRSPILHQFGSTAVMRISQNLVLKCGRSVLPSEAENMRFATANTTIRIPKVHHSFNVPGPGYFGTMGYIVMDYVEGTSLANCWDDLDFGKRQDVVNQVSGIIQQLQSVQFERPGPIGGGPCRGRWFTDYTAGPFAGRQEIENWFNHKLTICKGTGNARQDIPAFNFPAFVLTHQDISPRNLILDPCGQIWLIDWAYSGAYPPCFEAAALTDQAQFPDFSQQLLQKIHKNPREIEQLRSIKWGLTIAALA